MSKSSKSKNVSTQQQQLNAFAPALPGIEQGIQNIAGFQDFRSALPLQAEQSADTLAAQGALRGIAGDPSQLIQGAQQANQNLLGFQDPNAQRLGALSGLGGAIGLGGLADQARDPFSSQAFGAGINQLGTNIITQLGRVNTQTAGDLSGVGRFRGRGGGVDDLTFGRNSEQAFNAFSRGAADLGNQALGRQAAAQQQLFAGGLSGLGGAGQLGGQGAQIQQNAVNAAGQTFQQQLIQPGILAALGQQQDARSAQLLAAQQQQELQPLALNSGILGQLQGLGAQFGQTEGSGTATATSTPGLLDYLKIAGQIAAASQGIPTAAPQTQPQAQAQQAAPLQVAPQQQPQPFAPTALQLSGPF